MKRPIYMDYMATTPTDSRVIELMLGCLGEQGVFGNPASSNHIYGWEAQEKICDAAVEVASLIQADPREIVWTSGATESNNLAIKGAAYFYQRKGKHLVTMSTEHKSVLDTCRFLETKGFEVTYLDPEPNGLLNLDTLKSAIRSDTILVSIMHVNNETGVIQDIARIAEIAHQTGALFHTDCAQSAGKVAIDVRQMKIDLLSLSAHKIYGPKGVGALFVSRSPRVRLEPMIHGGAHQQGLRSGTLPPHQIVGMGEAFRLAKENFAADQLKLKTLRDRLWQGVSVVPGIYLNGDLEKQVYSCLNIQIDAVDAETLLLGLNSYLAISSGSACNSANPEPSHVLTRMGLTRDEANRSLRISIGRYTTKEEVVKAIHVLAEHIKQRRDQGSLWKVSHNGLLDQKE